LFRVQDEWFATEGYCPHGDVSLAEAYVEDDAVIECSAHLARFCLRTGEPLAPPADRALKRFGIKVEHGRVLIDLGDQESG
jgi:nitrite reductase/ring-hydroxylating ferredoxin subunit